MAVTYAKLSATGARASINGGSNIVRKVLAESTVAQNFVVDYRSSHDIYVVQCLQKRSNATTIGGSYPFFDGSQQGSLVVNRLNKNGTTQGKMYLVSEKKSGTHSDPYSSARLFQGPANSPAVGYGHGSNIGMEYTPNGTLYLWVDYRAGVLASSSPESVKRDAIGRSLVRFRFDGTNHSTYATGLVPNTTAGNSKLQEFSADALFPSRSSTQLLAMDSFSIQFDNDHRRAVVRYRDQLATTTEKNRIAVFNVSYSGQTPQFTLLQEFIYPRMEFSRTSLGTSNGSSKLLPRQGITIYGDYIYLNFGTGYQSSSSTLECPTTTGGKYRETGTLYGAGTTISKVGNNILVSYKWPGFVGQTAPVTLNWSNKYGYNHTESGAAYTYREPEGIYILPVWSGTPSSGTPVNNSLTALYGYGCDVVYGRTWSLHQKVTKE